MATTPPASPVNHKTLNRDRSDSELEKVESNASTESRTGLDPTSCGVTNDDVEWLARGNSLSQKNKGSRGRSRSITSPASVGGEDKDGSKVADKDADSTPKVAPSVETKALPDLPEENAHSPSPAQSPAHPVNGAATSDASTGAANGTNGASAEDGNSSLHRTATTPVPGSEYNSTSAPIDMKPPRRRMSLGNSGGGQTTQQYQYQQHQQQHQQSGSVPGRRSSWFHHLGNKLSISNQPTPPPEKSHFAGLKSEFNFNKQQHPQQQTVQDDGTSPSSGRHGKVLSVTTAGASIDPPRISSPKLNTDPAPPPGRAPADSALPSTSPKTGSLMTKLRRLSTRSNSGLASSVATSEVSLGSTASDMTRVILNRNLHKKHPKLAQLENSLPRRVMFSRDIIIDDPPQQIPARNPRTGNIVIQETGDIVRTAPCHSQGQYYFPRNYNSTARQASQTAYDTGVRVAGSVKSGGSFRAKFLPSYGSVDMAADADLNDGEYYSMSSKGLMIDKPTHGEGESNHMGSKSSAPVKPVAEVTDDESSEDDGTDESRAAKFASTSLEDIYTRCCHLREILPIAATMKQIKGHTMPLDILKMMNPRPTLIEILSFADFLSIVPVRLVAFDNVTLSAEMVRIILWSLVHSKQLLRLSLRNVILTDEGWKALCAFISENESLTRLDMSMQVDPKKCKLKPGVNRASMDWELFSQALIVRDGIEELILNGCMIPADDLEYLILHACSNSKRIGLAMNDLQHEDVDLLCKWLSKPTTVCEGLDLGGNDLNSSCSSMIKLAKLAKDLTFLSLNSTNIFDSESASEFLHALVEHAKSLRFLDLSSNPRLFPAITPTLAAMLPKFGDLRRIHLESCDLSPEDGMRLSEAFAECPKLVHISLVGNSRFEATVFAAVTAAVGLSSSIYTVELDTDRVPPSIRSRLAHYSLVNMEAIVTGISNMEAKDEEKLDDTELVESGKHLTDAVKEILSSKESDELSRNSVTEALVVRARVVRNAVQKEIERLFEQVEVGAALEKVKKEYLIKLVFLDGNLEKVLNQYDEVILQDKGQKDPGAASSLGTPHPMGQILGFLSVPGNAAQQDLKVAPIDGDSGVSLSRRSSTASLHTKAQDKEEGQFLKIGTFVTEHASEGVSTKSGEEIRQAVLMSSKRDRIAHLIEYAKQHRGPELDRIQGKIGEIMKDDDTKIDDKMLDQVLHDLTQLLYEARDRNADITPPADPVP